MLVIEIEAQDYWDERNKQFITTPSARLELHHSLVTLSKWEEVWEKPFLSSEKKTQEETLSYIRMMCVTPDFPPELFSHLTQEHYNRINTYLDAKMSATWFSEMPNQPRNREVITSEIIYFWMISLTIPFECQHWHLNKLFTLIKVCNEKNQQAQNKQGSGKRKPMTTSDLAARRALNEQRLKQSGGHG